MTEKLPPNPNFVGSDFLASEREIKSYLSPQSGFFYKAQLLEKVQSKYQLVSVWKTPDLGNTLVLDDQLMCGEKDEHHYHEALIYPALILKSALSQSSPLNALIVGGGDGGSCEELLKYPYIEHIDFVEIDKEVVRLSQKYLSKVHNNCYEHEKVSLFFEDGFSFVEKQKSRYDMVYLDLNDPIGTNPVVRLYTPEFFKSLKESVKNGGFVVMQIGAANYNEGFMKALELSHGAFNSVQLYNAYCPSYHCLNYFVILSEHSNHLFKMLNHKAQAHRFFTQKEYDTKIIEADNFGAYFSLPKDVRQLWQNVQNKIGDKL